MPNFKADKQLTIRLLSALALGPLVIFIVWLGGLPFWAMITLSAILCSWEWAKMTVRPRRYILAIFYSITIVSSIGLSVVGQYAAAFWVIIFGTLLVGLLAIIHKTRISDVTFAVIYIGAPHVCAIWLRGQPDGQILLLLIILAVWATDSAAYAAGRFFGGAKLAPKVSPNKTWSGAIGGLVAATATGFAYQILFAPKYIAVNLMIFAASLSIVSQFGDLFESLIKREFGAKDAGGLIPGHGGLLDRIDGLMAALLMATALLTFAPQLWSQG